MRRERLSELFYYIFDELIKNEIETFLILEKFMMYQLGIGFRLHDPVILFGRIYLRVYLDDFF